MWDRFTTCWYVLGGNAIGWYTYDVEIDWYIGHVSLGYFLIGIHEVNLDHCWLNVFD